MPGAEPAPQNIEPEEKTQQPKESYRTSEQAAAQEAKEKQRKSYKEVEKSLAKEAIKEKTVSRKEQEQIEKAEAASRKEEKDTFSSEMKRIERERQEEAGLAGAAAAPAGSTAKRTGKEDKKVEEISGGIGAPTSHEGLQPGGVQPSATAPAAYTYLHPHVLDLYERMVGVITVMSDAGITQTTVTLSNPEYAKSAFFGAQIIITEYSTAQKAFNVQIVASPQGVALFNANVDDLMAAFQNGKYNFKINRIEATLETEKPLFHRKEKAGGEEKGQGGAQR